VTVELSGFAKLMRESVRVDVGQAVALNVTMEVGNVAAVINVAPPMATVNAVTPEISNTIDTRRVNELPLNGRDFTRLTLFAPGVLQTSSLLASISVNATLGTVTRSGTGWTTNQRPNVVSGVDHVGGINGPIGWLNPTAFSDPATGTFGSLGRNTERGPHFVQVDVSLFKNVEMVGNQKVQLRVEIYNVINRLQLPPAPNANLLAPGSFGQFFNTFGRTEGFGTSRQIQFAVRYLF
jgi:hypothetical protein